MSHTLPTTESYLGDETRAMDRRRREIEQQNERALARVNAREHAIDPPQNAPEGELQNSILQHPELDTPRFDGTDNGLNPEPALNTTARTKFDNERREQDKEKQLKKELTLGLQPENAPRFSATPRPPGG
jgi:hypothetical protein